MTTSSAVANQSDCHARQRIGRFRLDALSLLRPPAAPRGRAAAGLRRGFAAPGRARPMDRRCVVEQGVTGQRRRRLGDVSMR